MKISGIYKISQLGTTKCYVGAAVDIDQRWRDHKSHLTRGLHHSPYLQNSWNKYGEAGFDFELVEECFGTKEELRLLLKGREQYWMDNLNSVFNVLPASYSMLGFKHSEESKKKRAESMRGRAHTEETKDRIRQIKLGTVASDETKKKMSAAQTGRKHSEESREKMRLAQKGNQGIRLAIERAAEFHRGVTLSEEHKSKISQSLKATRPTLSDEHKKKIGAAHKGRIFSEDHRKKISEAKKGKPLTPRKE